MIAVLLGASLVLPVSGSNLNALSRARQVASASFIPPEGLDVEKILVTEDARITGTHTSLPEGSSLEQVHLVRGDSAQKRLHTASIAPEPTFAAVQHVEAPIAPILKKSEARAEEKVGEEIEDRRWTMHLRAYCTASFASGITVGVVITLLLLSLGADRNPVKKLAKGTVDRNPEAPEVAESRSNRVERCTDGVESIHRFGPRCGFLVGMLLVQSLSSLMLAGFQDMIEHNPSIVFFLTMVVGTGGNVGGQSVVLAVRRLAYGEEVSLSEQVSVGVQLSMVLAPLALLRAYMQGTSIAVCLTIGLATLVIVVTAAALGTALPKLLNRIKVDPAHATPVIQVLMDMVGVLVTCGIGYTVLNVMMKRPAA